MDPQISYSTIDLLFGISTSLYSWTLGGQLYQGKSAYNFDVEQTIQKISLQEKIFHTKVRIKIYPRPLNLLLHPTILTPIDP